MLPSPWPRKSKQEDARLRAQWPRQLFPDLHERAHPLRMNLARANLTPTILARTHHVRSIPARLLRGRLISRRTIVLSSLPRAPISAPLSVPFSARSPRPCRTQIFSPQLKSQSLPAATSL